MSWNEHQEAVAAARAQVSELQELISVLTEKHEQVSSYVAQVTGGMDSNAAAGREAFEALAAMNQYIVDAYALAEQASNHLETYGGGF